MAVIARFGVEQVEPREVDAAMARVERETSAGMNEDNKLLFDFIDLGGGKRLVAEVRSQLIPHLDRHVGVDYTNTVSIHMNRWTNIGRRACMNSGNGDHQGGWAGANSWTSISWTNLSG